jgi:cell division protein ZapA (FtsZ GTPase activity inhibitor)
MDRQHVLGLAAEVDRRMREISSQARSVDSLKIAVLTALHLVEELQAHAGGNDDREKAIRSGSRKWIREIDKVL